MKSITTESPPREPHIICAEHGDMGTFAGLEGNKIVRFTVSGKTNYFCLRCVEHLLLEHLSPCEVKP